jgi:hypothetical protein
MKLEDFKKLEKKIENENFHSGYGNIDKVMFALSIFGHVASIFLAYFLIFKVISSAVENEIVASICTIILLAGLELLKREIFDKFALQHLKFKALFTKEVLPLLLISCTLVSVSFYATINGAKEFSSKEKEIEQGATTQLDTITTNIKGKYEVKIANYESEIDVIKAKIDQKDAEQTSLSEGSVNWTQRQRIKDLKADRDALKIDVEKVEGNIVSVKAEMDSEIGKISSTIEDKTAKKKGENQSNILMFVLISSIVEILIIAGVYFNEYYKHRSYNEIRLKNEKDPNFQSWKLYDSILDSIYSDEMKINDKIPSSKTIIEICKVNGVIVLQKDIINMLKLFNTIGIIRNSGSVKYISKSKEISIELLKKHFRIE